MKRYLYYGIAAILITACSQNELSEVKSLPEVKELVNLTSEEYASIAFDNPRELTESEAISIAKDFIATQEDLTGGRKTKSRAISPIFGNIEKSYYSNDARGMETRALTIGDDDLKIPIYKLSVKKGDFSGIMLVSGDERAKKVIAYTPIDNKKIVLPSAKLFEELAKASLLGDIKAINHLKDSLRCKTIDKISTKLGIDDSEFRFSKIENYISVNGEPLSKAKPIPTPPTQVLSYVLPMCKAQWDQIQPYNKELPIGEKVEVYFPGNYEKAHYPAGCAVVALAELMTVIQPHITAYGTTINWEYLTENPQIIEPNYFNPGDPADKREMVAKLIKDVYTKVKAFPIYNSENAVTGVATYDHECENYIRLYANCSGREKWNTDVVRNSILALRPVFIMGEGHKENTDKISKHAFLIDGYLLCKKNFGNVSSIVNTGSKELVKRYDLYFHANFGWASTGDGYYLINQDISVDFEAGGNVYKTADLRMISNIIRK